MTTSAKSSPNTRPDPPAPETTAAQVLVHEHSLILQALSAIEERLSALEKGSAPDRAFFEKAVEFLRNFADRCHHGKEENILFAMMVDELDYPRNGGPVAVLTTEHERGREFIREIAEAAGGKVRSIRSARMGVFQITAPNSRDVSARDNASSIIPPFTSRSLPASSFRKGPSSLH